LIRFHAGAPHRASRLACSVAVIGAIVACLEFSGWVYCALVSGVHASALTLPLRHT
jgi:hypothetical protein